MPAPPAAQQQGFLAPNDPLMAVGSTMLRQSGATYLESGKRYVESWTGVLSGAMLQHQFDISASYGLLITPPLTAHLHECSLLLSKDLAQHDHSDSEIRLNVKLACSAQQAADAAGALPAAVELHKGARTGVVT